MMFGEHQSESPRVPSPWANTRRGSSSRHSSANSSRIGNVDLTNPSNPLRKVSSTSSPNFSPLSRAVQVRNAEAYRASFDIERRETENGSTPPIEEDEYGFGEGLNSFFALDSDVDVQRLSSSQRSSSSDILTPLDGVDLVHSRNPASTHQKRNRKKRVARLAPEPDVLGNLEYKLRIIPPTRHRYDKLLTQMKWRVLQGGGECTYEIGVLDDGLCIGICPFEMQASLSMLSVMAKELNASVLVKKVFEVISLDPHTQNAGGEVKPLTNEQALELLESRSHTNQHIICECGMDFKSSHEAAQYLTKFGDHRTRIGSAEISSDEFCPGEVVIAIEKNVEDMFTYTQDGKDNENESDTSSENEEDPSDDFGEEFFMEDERETTFSLSLDERATRAGLGFQRRAKAMRRRCRYNVESAMANRPRARVTMAPSMSPPVPLMTKVTVDVVNAQDPIETLYVPMSSISVSEGFHSSTVQSMPHQNANQEENSILEKDTIYQTEARCIRLIVEASILRDADEEAFIDYGSL